MHRLFPLLCISTPHPLSCTSVSFGPRANHTRVVPVCRPQVSLVFSAAFVKSVLCGLAQEVSVMLSPLEEGQRVCSPLTESQKEECVYYYDH